MAFAKGGAAGSANTGSLFGVATLVYARPDDVPTILAAVPGWTDLLKNYCTGRSWIRFRLRAVRPDEDESELYKICSQRWRGRERYVSVYLHGEMISSSIK